MGKLVIAAIRTTLKHKVRSGYDWETTKWNALTQAEKMDNADSYGNSAADCHQSYGTAKQAHLPSINRINQN
jgi:hypothetical protein